jgi:hypothetical protein
MLDALFELIFQFIVEFVFQILIELGFECVAEFFHRRPTLRTVVVLIFIPLLGAFVGLFLSNMIPERILPKPPVPGVSLFLSPLATGLVMKLFGDWRRRSGCQPTTLATFWGGALFAFSMALVRWLRVGRVV